MKIEHFVEEMTQSIEKVEESVGNMEIHKNAEKNQIVQAIMELSERIKLIEAHMESRHM